MTPLEEQVEKLARRWEKEADEGELLDEVAYALEGAADELRTLLPLEVTDEMVERGARAFWEGISASLRGSWSSQNITVKDRYRHLTRACLSAALTQKGDNE